MAITAPAAAARRRGHSTRRQSRAAYVLILPFFLVFALMLIVPLAYSAYLSLFQSQLIGGEQFAWFANYLRAFTDPKFLAGLGRMAIFLVIAFDALVAITLSILGI